MSEWIEHDGMGMPVDGEAIVTVRFRDDVTSGAFHKAKFFGEKEEEGSNWFHSSTYSYPEDDIVAYRIVE